MSGYTAYCDLPNGERIELPASMPDVEKTDGFKLSIDDAYVVWFCKTLQNWKALVSTTVSDGMYYEVTYNGDKDEIYVDAYKKWKNKQIKNTISI